MMLVYFDSFISRYFYIFAIIATLLIAYYQRSKKGRTVVSVLFFIGVCYLNLVIAAKANFFGINFYENLKCYSFIVFDCIAKLFDAILLMIDFYKANFNILMVVYEFASLKNYNFLIDNYLFAVKLYIYIGYNTISTRLMIIVIFIKEVTVKIENISSLHLVIRC